MKFIRNTLWRILLLCLVGMSGLAQPAVANQTGEQRIVSLNGAISEIVCALGLEQQIVGVDVTSTFPASLKEKPQVGHNRNISAEGILSLNPTLVLALKKQLTPQLSAQLKSAGIKTVLLKQEFSAAGVREMVLDISEAVNEKISVKEVLARFSSQMKNLNLSPLDRKVLFIYARGAGTMLVSGAGTSVDKVLSLAGARNAVTTFSDFKPLTAESLVAANPDVILMFTDGLKSMGGMNGLLKVPGIAQTRAGINKAIITMDGELLTGFTLRLPIAIKTLHDKIAAK